MELHTKLQTAGFEVVKLDEFNRLGVPAWRFNKWRGRREIRPSQMRTFGWLLPIAKAVESMKIGSGISLIAVGRKPAA